jgi:hypothetical protein
MPELLQKPLDNDNKTSFRPGKIIEGDRNSRFWVSLQNGSITLDIADDIVKKYIVANKMIEAVEQFQKTKEILAEELSKTETLITSWLEKHNDRIIPEKTGFVGTPVVSSNGMMRYRFLITQKSSDVFFDEDLDNELTALEECILKEIEPQMIRIDTLLLPDINADISNIDA